MWKIGDFGLTMPGTSRHHRSTNQGRGTDGYRAPELHDDTHTGKYSYNQKCDIWALGCILYELIFKVKPFKTDYEALSSRKKPTRIPIHDIDSRSNFILSALIGSMLEIPTYLRPDVTDVLRMLVILGQRGETPVNLSNCSHQQPILASVFSHLLFGRHSTIDCLAQYSDTIGSTTVIREDRLFDLEAKNSLWKKAIWTAHWYDQISHIQLMQNLVHIVVGL